MEPEDLSTYQGVLGQIRSHAYVVCCSTPAERLDFVQQHQLPLLVGQHLEHSLLPPFALLDDLRPVYNTDANGLPVTSRFQGTLFRRLRTRSRRYNTGNSSGTQQCYQSNMMPSYQSFATFLAHELQIARQDAQNASAASQDAGPLIQAGTSMISFFGALCSMWLGGILRAQAAASSVAPTLDLAVQLLRSIATTASAAHDSQAALAASCSIGGSLTGPLTDKLQAAEAAAAAGQIDPLWAELLPGGSTCPPLLLLVLLVLVQQVRQLAQNYVEYQRLADQQVCVKQQETVDGSSSSTTSAPVASNTSSRRSCREPAATA